MQPTRALVVAGGCAAILGTGYAVSPKELPSLDFVVPEADDSDATAAPSVDGSGDATELVEVNGATVPTKRGPVQVQLVLEGDQIVGINGLVLGSPHPRTIDVVAEAFPVLRDRVLEAQSYQVEYASGASFFSPGFTESVRTAMVTAGLVEDGEAIAQPGEAADGTADYTQSGPDGEDFIIPEWADEEATDV